MDSVNVVCEPLIWFVFCWYPLKLILNFFFFFYDHPPLPSQEHQPEARMEAKQLELEPASYTASKHQRRRVNPLNPKASPSCWNVWEGMGPDGTFKRWGDSTAHRAITRVGPQWKPACLGLPACSLHLTKWPLERVPNSINKKGRH